MRVIIWVGLFFTGTDVLVQWDDGSQNVVAVEELRTEPEDHVALSPGSKVSMWWKPQKMWLHGRVVTFDGHEEGPSSDDEDDDNLPLTRLISKLSSGVREVIDVSRADTHHDDLHNPNKCETFDCEKEIWACMCLLCLIISRTVPPAIFTTE